MFDMYVFFPESRIDDCRVRFSSKFITIRAHFTISMALSQKHEKHENAFLRHKKEGEEEKKNNSQN